MNEIIAYSQIAETQYIKLLQQLINDGKTDVDVITLIQARIIDKEARNALRDAQQNIDEETARQVELGVCRAVIAYYQEVKSALDLQVPRLEQSLLEHKRNALNLPVAIKNIEPLLKQQLMGKAAFSDKRNPDQVGKEDLDKLDALDKLDQYDCALRDAILKDGVPIRSSTAWELRRLQIVLNIAEHRTIQPEALRSEFLKEINYIPLWRLLEAKQWQKANQITQKLMLQVVQQNRLWQLRQTKAWQQSNEATRQSMTQTVLQAGSLELTDIQNFPCVDLLTIDHLWLWFSKGKFGFRVQNQIWRWLDADLNQFGQQVGWLTPTGWIASNYLQGFSEAESGHLPFLQPIFQPVAPQHLATYMQTCLNELLQRLENCPIRVAS